ncbi:hypothetical protein BpHYR1_023928 [Brachionus plicatilis]|uniref:Uncharacterized protein n=1 Tax=Brachionus plicatilis TaxID=10195 RepID=A0A3M7S5N9_BRAPC|nr:hypothetical protein BpHYR1_023928 [Brachionus plicatilis]
MYSSRRPVVKSDSDSDVESRYRSSFSKESSKSYNYPSSARNSVSRDLRDVRDPRDSRELRPIRDTRERDNDRYESSSRYNSYRSTSNKFQSDSEDDKPSSRYGVSSRRTARRSSDSEDSDDKNDRFRRTMTSSKSSRPLTSTRRKAEDFDSYENANQKLKEMIQYDKNLCEQLDDIYDSKLAKEKKIEQLKEDIHRDTLK